MAKNKFKGIVVLSRDKYTKLDKVEDGTLYVKNQFVDTPEKVSELENDSKFLNQEDLENISLDLKNTPKVNGKDIALKEDIPPIVTNLETDSNTKPLAASQGKVLNDKITAAMEVMHGKNNAFTVKSFLEFRLLFGIEIGEGEVEAQDSYKVSTNKITYNGKEYTLKNGDVFYLVREDVPDYWFSSDDMTLYAMETNKVDLTEYALITYVDDEILEQSKVIAEKANDNDLAKVAKTNNYNDLDNKPEDLATTTYVSENYLPKGTKVGDLENDVKYATEEFVNTNGGKIDKIKVNGIEQEIKDKTVDLTIEHPEETFGAKKGISGKDLNTIIEQGNYGIASDCNNLPITLPGTLFVGISEKGNYPQQTFIDNADGMWIRNSTSLDNSTWSEWKKLTNTKDLKEVKDSIPKLLDDLDDDSSHRLVTDEEKEYWNSKAGVVTEQGEIFNNYTNNVATGGFSHAEGNKNTASGFASHAEGSENTASGEMTHAEGINNKAIGDYSHVEGQYNEVEGLSGHAEGTMTKAKGIGSHAEGAFTNANGICSHAGGMFTTADQDFQTAIGIANEEGKENALFSIGGGSLNEDMSAVAERKTVFEVFKDGRVEINGVKAATINDISDVTGYATTEYVNEGLKDKVDKDGNKVLSTNDYTNEDKNKVDSLKALAYKNSLTASDVGALPSNTTYVTSVNGNSGTITGLAQQSDVDTLNTQVSNLSNDKVDKETGKGLSTNDFTDTYKGQLDNLKEYDDTTIKNDISSLQSGKVDKDGNKVLSTNDYTNDDKSKVDDLKALAYKDSLSKSDVGLGSVDNTSDASKPISNATQDALNLKADSSTVNGVITRVSTIEGKIPAQASSTNQLADKAFVNSSIATATSTFRGTYDTLAALQSQSADENDYGFVRSTDELGNKVFQRHKYTNNEWVYEYDLNNSSFTQAQWDAINSGVTSANVTQISTNTTNISNLDTNKADKSSLGVAAAKGVVTSIDTSANLPTSNAVKTFVEGKKYLTGITSSQVTSALGYTPYNSTNPNGYITSSGSITGNAATATKATQDGNGNNIVNTYATKDALSTVENKIQTVNNGTLTIQKNGSSVGTFTANQSSNSTINITVPTGTASNSNVATTVTASNDLPTSNAIISYVTTEIGKIEPITEISNSITNIWELNPGIYSFVSNMSAIYSLYYKQSTNISESSFQYGGGVLIVTDAKFGHTGSSVEPVTGKDFVFLPTNEKFIYYGHAHKSEGKVFNFYMNPNYITNTVNNLTNYYTKAETYTQTEIDEIVASITGSIDTSGFMTKSNPVGTGYFSFNRKSSTSNGSGSVALGYNGTASGSYSVALGYNTRATGSYSHAQGYGTGASGTYSTAEGYNCNAYSTADHAEGYNSYANGYASHAEGYSTHAYGWYSHSQGIGTEVNHRSQHVAGEYNTLDTSTNGYDQRGTYVEIIGNGSNSSNRSNARTLDWEGNEVLSGNITATGFKVPDGTSNQVLTADGGVTEISSNEEKEIFSTQHDLFSLNEWKNTSFFHKKGFSFYGNEVWVAGENIYYSNGSNKQYKFVKSKKSWESAPWGNSLYGTHMWTDGTNYYNSWGSDHYKLDLSTNTWNKISFSGVTSFNADDIWTDGTDTYYSNGGHYKLSGTSWSSCSLGQTFLGQYVWYDGDNVYASNGSTGLSPLKFNKSTKTWESFGWKGENYPNPGSIWTDGTNLYHFRNNEHKILDRSTSTWNLTSFSGIDNANFRASYVWQSDGEVYHSNNGVHHKLDKETRTWTSISFGEMVRDLFGRYFWTDNINIYYSTGSTQYLLNKSTGELINKTWNGLTSFSGKNIWTDGDDIYCYTESPNKHYKLNSLTDTWSEITWNGLPTAFQGYIWSDGENIYYTWLSHQYVLDRNTKTWLVKTWASKPTSFYGSGVWSDGTNIYYSYGSDQYILDKENDKWVSFTWKGLTNFYASEVWSDGENIYRSSVESNYVLDRNTKTWNTMSWNGVTSITPTYIWVYGDNIYWLDGTGCNKVLSKKKYSVRMSDNGAFQKLRDKKVTLTLDGTKLIIGYE